ncbi:MAG: aminotransferase [Candidatus Hydrogenedentota bacterium]
MTLDEIVRNESLRQSLAPVTAHQVFLAHAGVAPLPRVAIDAMQEYLRRSGNGMQENSWTAERVRLARETAAELLGATAGEIALLGPTALGLSLVANGLSWQVGDEVIYYQDDYPANVYPWKRLESRGVKAVSLEPKQPGAITWELIEKSITPKTRLVSLATCSFLSGYRIDFDAIGRQCQDRGILFCLDAIQSLGAFPMSVQYVDFLSADSHKWLLGPCGAGIVYVKASRFEQLEPTLVGSWNVLSPNFIAQDQIAYPNHAQRYEPGSLNLPGIVGMEASMRWLLNLGIEHIGQRLRDLRHYFLDRVRPEGYQVYFESVGTGHSMPESAESGIISVVHDRFDLSEVSRTLAAHNVIASLRRNRAGREILRFSPHFYTTKEELDRVAGMLK